MVSKNFVTTVGAVVCGVIIAGWALRWFDHSDIEFLEWSHEGYAGS